MPRAGLCDGKATDLAGGVAGEMRLKSCWKLGGTGVGVVGFDEHLGNGNGGTSFNAD